MSFEPMKDQPPLPKEVASKLPPSRQIFKRLPGPQQKCEKCDPTHGTRRGNDLVCGDCGRVVYLNALRAPGAPETAPDAPDGLTPGERNFGDYIGG